ncbi:hypothetical protein GQX73_g6745 [Xylaria multiplex]|uniref:Uncharacterized protein n=1 Tax=Xylaria multiplex TaxID=323545 RepID=A0A7C8ILQ0_9PEZI|nr:hypothetical protein GQX73_g6745 [Xylaria multiplex]
MYAKPFASLATLASVVAAAPALEHETRATTAWTATGGTEFFLGHPSLNGVEFDLSAPAGYLPDAPAFDVHCLGYYYFSGTAPKGTACAWKGARPEGSSVYASTDYYTLAVTVRHEWLAPGGTTKVNTGVGTLPARPTVGVTLDPFALQVNDTAAKL